MSEFNLQEFLPSFPTGKRYISPTFLPGQIIQYKFAVFHQGLTIFSDTRDYFETPTKLTITPKSSNSIIEVSATGTAIVNAEWPESPIDITLFKNGVDALAAETPEYTGTRAYRFLSGAHDFTFDPSRGVVDNQTPCNLDFTEDSPGAGVPVTYAVRIRCGDALTLPNPPPRYSATWSFSGGTPLYSHMRIREIEKPS